MRQLTKEEVKDIRSRVEKMPDDVYRTLAKIVGCYQLNEVPPFVRTKIDGILSNLIYRQLIIVKTGKFPYDDKVYRYLFLPTQLGYEYVLKIKAPSQLPLPERWVKYLDNDERKREKDFAIEYSGDTESRMMEDDENDEYQYKLAQISTDNDCGCEGDECLELTDSDFMVRVLRETYETKINPKQLLLKQGLLSFVINPKMASDDFIKANYLQTLLDFQITMKGCEEEDWCIKVFEYMRKHFPNGRG